MYACVTDPEGQPVAQPWNFLHMWSHWTLINAIPDRYKALTTLMQAAVLTENKIYSKRLPHFTVFEALCVKSLRLASEAASRSTSHDVLALQVRCPVSSTDQRRPDDISFASHD